MSTPIYEDLTFTILEEHWDDVLTCNRCEAEATVRISNRCCGFTFFKCSTHEAKWQAAVQSHIGTARHCVACQVSVYPYGFDFFRVVPL